MFKNKSLVTVITSSLILSSIFWMSRPALAELLSWDQHAELWKSGTITDPKTNKKWNVVMVPGATEINKMAKKG